MSSVGDTRMLDAICDGPMPGLLPIEFECFITENMRGLLRAMGISHNNFAVELRYRGGETPSLTTIMLKLPGVCVLVGGYFDEYTRVTINYEPASTSENHLVVTMSAGLRSDHRVMLKTLAEAIGCAVVLSDLPALLLADDSDLMWVALMSAGRLGRFVDVDECGEIFRNMNISDAQVNAAALCARRNSSAGCVDNSHSLEWCILNALKCAGHDVAMGRYNGRLAFRVVLSSSLTLLVCIGERWEYTVRCGVTSVTCVFHVPDDEDGLIAVKAQVVLGIVSILGSSTCKKAVPAFNMGRALGVAQMIRSSLPIRQSVIDSLIALTPEDRA
jgi:hypothetical protein